MRHDAKANENLSRDEGVDRAGIDEKVHSFALIRVCWICDSESQHGQSHDAILAGRIIGPTANGATLPKAHDLLWRVRCIARPTPNSNARSRSKSSLLLSRSVGRAPTTHFTR